MPWKGPDERADFPSLGWTLLDWIVEHLPSPDDESKPFVLTDEQARLLVRFYGLDAESGQFTYRRGCWEGPKGVGKSPWEAARQLCELCGPVVFDGWDAQGEPVGRPWGTGGLPAPWVQIAATSEDQTDNIHEVTYELLVANDGKAAEALGVDVGRTRLYLQGRKGRLERVTAAAGSREGQRITSATLEETWLWTPERGGVKLARTLRRNLGKMGGRSFETTNVPVLGEGSVAQKTAKAVERGERGVLYYAPRPSAEPDPDMPDDELLGLLDEAYRDAYWVDRRRLLADARDPDMPWDEVLRFSFNLPQPGAGKAVDPRKWRKLARPGDEPEPGSRIGVGFDGSISEDCTVLVGCCGQFEWLIDAWVRPKGPKGRKWRVPRKAVHEAVAHTFETFDVGRMLCDEAKWWTEIEEWQSLYGEEVVLGIPTNSDRRFAPMVDRWLTAYRNETLTHSGEELLTDHVEAAQLRKARAKDPDDDERTLYTLTKGDDGRKIDGSVGGVLALEAEMTMPEPVEEESLEPMMAVTD